MSGTVTVQTIESSQALQRERPVKEASGFADTLAKAVDSVDRLQVQADQQAAQVAQGGGNLHETALALEKADVAMRVAMKTRNKLIDAYHEIMRMSV